MSRVHPNFHKYSNSDDLIPSSLLKIDILPGYVAQAVNNDHVESVC